MNIEILIYFRWQHLPKKKCSEVASSHTHQKKKRAMEYTSLVLVATIGIGYVV